MLVLVGSRVRYRTLGHGIFHCERCGGDRPYRHRSGRRLAHLLGFPVAVLGATGEHLRCATCLTCYRVELLAVPTTEQMRLALLAGTTASVVAMLRAGNAVSPDARRQGIEAIRAAGAPQYDEARLMTALAGARHGVRPGPVVGLRPAIEALAVQLDPLAREWFLARVVQVGLGGGSLSDGQREVIGTVARYLGLSQAKASAVIALTEEAAQAG